MVTPRSSNDKRVFRPRRTRRNSAPERVVLLLALLVPLGLLVVMLAQMPTPGASPPSSEVDTDSSDPLIASRPAPSNPAPPPTLAPGPTATPPPTPTSAASPTPSTGRTYTVRSGDQLKDIAAAYHLTIGQISSANNIPNADSLKVGQVLKIPNS